MTEPDHRPLVEFIRQRSDWLAVTVEPHCGQWPGGYDVVLRLDGTYADPSNAAGIADYLAGQLADALAAAHLLSPDLARQVHAARRCRNVVEG